jgi:nitrile hydratase accessory protein
MSGKTVHRVLPDRPRDGDAPVFAEPWQAQAFALTVRLHEAGHFTWNEWAETLGAEIEAAKARGDPDLGDTYYRHWLAALERLAAEKGLARGDELGTRKAAWKRAFLNTPHGEPVTLEAGEADG